MRDDVRVAVVDAGHPDARWAMTQYLAELDRRFPGGFDPGDAVAAAASSFNPPAGVFVVARHGDELVGCGGVQYLDGDTAEIKRMWVSPAARGAGVGQRLLAALEAEGRRARRSRFVLDTNGTLAEAIRLYASMGYVEIERYNDNPYADHWFEKVDTGA